MPIDISFNYELAANDPFFNIPGVKTALDNAANTWESLLNNANNNIEFPDIAAKESQSDQKNREFEVIDPYGKILGDSLTDITLSSDIDDIVIYVGSSYIGPFIDSTNQQPSLIAALAFIENIPQGSTRYPRAKGLETAIFDIRRGGEKQPYQPSIATMWFNTLGDATPSDPHPQNWNLDQNIDTTPVQVTVGNFTLSLSKEIDLESMALHEIGHILGFNEGRPFQSHVNQSSNIFTLLDGTSIQLDAEKVHTDIQLTSSLMSVGATRDMIALGADYRSGPSQDDLKILSTLGYDFSLGNPYPLIAQGTVDDDKIPGSEIIDDTLQGLGGDDSISGAGGNDSLEGNLGKDLLLGGSGDDTIKGDEENDILYGDFEVEGFESLSGNDSLFGGDGNDSIFGGYGDDSIDGGQGIDTIDAGPGNDYSKTDPADVIIGNSVEKFVSGNLGNDTLIGSKGHDQLFGGVGNDSLEGDDGDDTIEGELGDDILIGGKGNDSVWGEDIATPFFDDFISGIDYDDYIAVDDGEDYVQGGYGNDSIYGGDDDDVLFGDGEYNPGQDDIILTSHSHDLIEGEDGEDRINAGLGNDTIYGGSGDDTIYGEFMHIPDQTVMDYYEYLGDEIYGGDGDDLILGEYGEDTLVGGPGNDTLDGSETTEGFLPTGTVAGYLDSVLAGSDKINRGMNGEIDVLIGDPEQSPTNFILADENGPWYLGGGHAVIRNINPGGVLTLYYDPAYCTNLGPDGECLDWPYEFTEVGTDVHLTHNGDIIAVLENLSLAECEGSGIRINMIHKGGITEGFTIGSRYGVLPCDDFSHPPTVPNATDGDDTLAGGDEDDDVIAGLDGDDLIYGLGGDDQLFGDDGNSSSASLSSSPSPVASNSESIIGNDTLYGGGGADVLTGGEGIDAYFGGTGNDTLYVSASDVVALEAGLTTIDGGDGADWVYIDDIGDGTPLYLNVSNVSAGRFYASNVDTTFDATGDIRIMRFWGAAGNDTLYGGLNEDLLQGGDGNDYLDGGDGNDNLFGNAGDDTIYGRADNDYLLGYEGNDNIYGETGNDNIDGGYGDDTLYGADGDDYIKGQADKDLLYGEAGNDTLSGSWNHDTLDGGVGDDY